MKNNIKKSNINIKVTILIILSILLIISIVPLLQISSYNQPSRDDYIFGYYLHNNHDTIFDIFHSVITGARNTFDKWQGLFVVNLMLAMVPSAISSKYYTLTAYIGVVSLIIATWFFARQLLYKYLKFKKIDYWIVLLIMVFVQLQLMPSVVEGLYWYPAVVTYTVPYTIMLLFFGTILSLINSKKKSIITYIISIVLAILISGCNYITILTTLLSLASFIVYSIIFNKKLPIHILFLFLVIIPGFIISILAPGNALRGETFQKMSAIGAILISFPAAARSIINLVFRLPFIVSILAMVPFIWNSVNNKNYRLFKHPVLMFIFSFCLYAATFTPTYYAMYGTGLGRVENIRMFTLMWLIVLNMFITVGYIKQFLNKLLKDNGIDNTTIDKMKKTVSNKFSGLITIIMIGIAIVSCYVVGIDDIASISAANSLLNGEAHQYKSEYIERELLLESEQENIEIEPLTVHPNVLFFWEIAYGISGNRCEYTENYYDKESVVLK